MDKDKNTPQKIKIEIDEKVGEGSYANFAVVTHSLAEFILDFISLMPGSPKAKVKSRIIITPEHAKRLNKALKENIEKFEVSNGEIKTQIEPKFPVNFGPTGEA